MNASWLLSWKTLGWALGISSLLSMVILIMAPSGLSDLKRRKAELRALEAELREQRARNQALEEEVQRLAVKDPELFETLARRQGFARPGETIYTFREKR